MERYICGIEKFNDEFKVGFRVDILYQVGGIPLASMSCDTSLQSKLWHSRFSHLHYKALPNVRNMVTGIEKFKLEYEGVFQGCGKGKHTRGPFSSSDSKTTNILQFFHSNLSSMMPVNVLGGYLYYAISMYGFSCNTWIYFMKRKDE